MQFFSLSLSLDCFPFVLSFCFWFVSSSRNKEFCGIVVKQPDYAVLFDIYGEGCSEFVFTGHTKRSKCILYKIPEIICNTGALLNAVKSNVFQQMAPSGLTLIATNLDKISYVLRVTETLVKKNINTFLKFFFNGTLKN